MVFNCFVCFIFGFCFLAYTIKKQMRAPRLTSQGVQMYHKASQHFQATHQHAWISHQNSRISQRIIRFIIQYCAECWE